VAVRVAVRGPAGAASGRQPGGRFARWPRVDQSFLPSWVRPDFARGHGMWGRAVDLARLRNQPTAEAGQDRFELVSLAGDWGGWYVASASHGMLSGHPFLASRGLQFVLSVPRRLKEQPGRRKGRES
jgi:hypothetical protein